MKLKAKEIIPDTCIATGIILGLTSLLPEPTNIYIGIGLVIIGLVLVGVRGY